MLKVDYLNGNWKKKKRTCKSTLSMSICGCNLLLIFLFMTAFRKRITSIALRTLAMISANNNSDNPRGSSTGFDMVKRLVVTIDAFTATTAFLSDLFRSGEDIVLSPPKPVVLWHRTHFVNEEETGEDEGSWWNGTIECRNNLVVAISMEWYWVNSNF